MNHVAWPADVSVFPPGSDKPWPVVRRRPLQNSTTVIERFLLMVTVILIPVEDSVPTIAGFSILFIVFGLLAMYVFVWRPRTLAKVLLHPVFLTAYILLMVGFLSEFVRPFESYRVLISFGLMIAGAAFIATLCRDILTLRLGMYAYIIASVWLSFLLFLSSYGALNRATATNFSEASIVRSKMAKDIPVGGDLNAIAFLAAQGGVVSFALTLTSRSVLQRALFAGSALFCLVAAFLPMSRSGIIIAASSCMMVLFRSRVKRLQAMGIAIIIGVSVLTLVPDAVFSRLQGLGEMKGRDGIYTAALKSMPEYMLGGVGAGNFWSSWAYNNGFVSYAGHALGAHNTFLQIMIFWGLAALLSLFTLIWQAYRCLPKRCGDDPLALSLLGIATALLLVAFFTHTFYDKTYSLGLGLLVGSRLWIWPNGVIQTVTQKRRRLGVV